MHSWRAPSFRQDRTGVLELFYYNNYSTVYNLCHIRNFLSIFSALLSARVGWFSCLTHIILPSIFQEEKGSKTTAYPTFRRTKTLENPDAAMSSGFLKFHFLFLVPCLFSYICSYYSAAFVRNSGQTKKAAPALRWNGGGLDVLFKVLKS